jgi:hypothetical protein
MKKRFQQLKQSEIICLNANPVCSILKLNTNGFQSLNLTTSELIELIEKKIYR